MTHLMANNMNHQRNEDSRHEAIKALVCPVLAADVERLRHSD